MAGRVCVQYSHQTIDYKFRDKFDGQGRSQAWLGVGNGV